jgi:hypothetical protein
MFPDAITNEADKAARNTFSSILCTGRQITAATITEMKVIKKLSGRISCIIAVIFLSKLVENFAETYKKNKYLVVCLNKT